MRAGFYGVPHIRFVAPAPNYDEVFTAVPAGLFFRRNLFRLRGMAWLVLELAIKMSRRLRSLLMAVRGNLMLL
jgi:hypothetical protein